MQHRYPFDELLGREPSALMVKAGLLALLLLADAGSTVPSTSADPYAIYERCVAMMNADPTPPYAVYVLRIEAQNINIVRGYSKSGAPTTKLEFGRTHEQAAYRVWYRARDQRSLMQDLASNAAVVTPPVPWALDLAAPPAGTTEDSTGQSVSGKSVEIEDATQLLSEVKIDAKDAYRISLAGMEMYAGHRAYHLAIENVGGDPNDHPLRTLLVDSETFRPLQVVIEVGQRGMLYGGGLTLSANFGAAGGYWLSTSGSVIGNGHFAFIRVRGTYTYSASDFVFPPELPKSMFNAH